MRGGDPSILVPESRAVHVILPAFNEVDSLPPLLNRLAELASEMANPMVAWVVDDGSEDGTAQAARCEVGKLDVRLVRHSVNMGLGQALHTGLRSVIEAAQDNDVAVVMDADDTHDVRLIPHMIERIQQGDRIVIASRFVKGGDDRTAPRFRRFLSRGAAIVFRGLFPLEGFKDFTSGYRAYSVELLRNASTYWGQRLIEERGFACMVELLLKLRHWKPGISEVPLVLRYDRKQGTSKLRLWRTIRQYIKLAIRDWLAPPPGPMAFMKATIDDSLGKVVVWR